MRRAKAAALASLADGRLNLSEALRRPPGALNDVDLHDVLVRCPRMGRESARRVCESAGVWPLTRMRHLSEPQRAALVRALPSRVQ